MFLVVLGRQSQISLAELEAIYNAKNITPLSDNLALVKTKTIHLSRLGGTIKAGEILSTGAPEHLQNLPPGKITLGISDFRKKATAKTAFTEGLKLKNLLRRHHRSVRLIPNNNGPTLSSATSHHSQLGEKTNHLELAFFDNNRIAALTPQNITAYARRDQARPARDAFVGMLPPKLAQILINLATGPATTGHLLDPFCGTGTILQEALLMGFSVAGTDLSEKMITYTRKNLDWLIKNHAAELTVADATKHKWIGEVDFVSSEIYLGQPFSAPPSDIKLKEVKHTTKSILLSFLKNIHPQLKTGTPLALAIPAWRRVDDTFSCLNIVDAAEKIGYNVHKFQHATRDNLLYHREGQIVARQIIVLRKT